MGGMVTDLTARQQAHEALRQSEERWRAVFENSAVGIALTDCVSTRFQAANLAFQRMVGYAEDELRGLTFMDITHEDRSASGSRNGAAIRRVSSAAWASGIVAAVTNNGRAEFPCRASTAWLAVRNRVLATPMTGTPYAACACAPRPGRPAGIRVDVAVHDQQAEVAHRRQHGAQRRFAQEELAWLVRQHRGTGTVHSAWTAGRAACPAVTAAARALPERRLCTSTATNTSRRPSVIPP